MSAGRVCRGGGWYHTARDLRASFRLRYDPSYRFGNLGFRLVEEPVDEVDVEDTLRVLRGGSWHDVASDARVADRLSNDPSYRSDFLGFRLVEEQGGE